MGSFENTGNEIETHGCVKITFKIWKYISLNFEFKALKTKFRKNDLMYYRSIILPVVFFMGVKLGLSR
jgi:hypothetical protein